MENYQNLSLENLPNEEWRFIPNCDNLYMVSNMGRIKALASIRKFGNTQRRHRERIIAQCKNWQGYLGCRISDLNQNKIRISVHKAVCDAFHDNPNNLPCVNHKNEIKWDNRAENLEHCTYSYNITYGSREGEKDIPVLQYSIDGKFIKEFKSVKQASEQLGIHRHSISNVTHGWAKSAGGYVWRLKNGDKIGSILEYKDNNKRAILCYDVDGRFIKEYPSLISAEKDLGVKYQRISACCRGIVKKVKCYTFKYK